MATKRKVRRFGDGGVTEEDLSAANESEDPIAELNKRKGWTGADEESEPTTRGLSVKQPAAEKAKPKIVTKEELAKSGLSLRDYMNKQQGLTRRGEKSTPAPVAEKAEPKVEPKAKYETPYDRSRREDREAGRDFDSLIGKLKSKFTGEDTRKALPLKSTKSETGNKFMGSTGLKKGGSVSSASRRADGIATKGKTKGRMV